jgi:hypothetical protein
MDSHCASRAHATACRRTQPAPSGRWAACTRGTSCASHGSGRSTTRGISRRDATPWLTCHAKPPTKVWQAGSLRASVRRHRRILLEYGSALAPSGGPPGPRSPQPARSRPGRLTRRSAGFADCIEYEALARFAGRWVQGGAGVGGAPRVGLARAVRQRHPRRPGGARAAPGHQ